MGLEGAEGGGGRSYQVNAQAWRSLPNSQLTPSLCSALGYHAACMLPEVANIHTGFKL